MNHVITFGDVVKGSVAVLIIVLVVALIGAAVSRFGNVFKD